MEFYTTAEDGQVRPVHECLQVECGRDFEKCARWNTVFNYSPYNGGYETHENFWSGRKFEVLMVPGGKWLAGEVIEWNEYTMGPGDRFCKWRLMARMRPSDDDIGKGSLVVPEGEHDGDDEKVALVTHVEDDGKVCTLSSKDESAPATCNLNELRPFCGAMKFNVHRMNVQGGGILKYSNLTSYKLSMKWTERVSVEGADGTEYHSKYHFDPEERRLDKEKLASLAESERVVELRAKHLKMIEDDPVVIRNEAAKLTLFHSLLVGEIVDGMAGDDLDIERFQHALLSIPFLLYVIAVDGVARAFRGERGDDHPLLQIELSNDERCLIFRSMVDVGLYLRDDVVCREQFLSDKLSAGLEYDADQLMDEALCHVILEVGDFFQHELQEYRAAIWALNLAPCRDSRYTFPGKNDLLVTYLNKIALCNKEIDNLAAASDALEEVILACPAAERRPDVQLASQLLAKQTVHEAKEWFGTSGTIVSFDGSDETDGEKPCSSCGAEGARKRCSACSMRYYCNKTCQASGWSVHKQTCLGKMRGK